MGSESHGRCEGSTGADPFRLDARQSGPAPRSGPPRTACPAWRANRDRRCAAERAAGRCRHLAGLRRTCGIRGETKHEGCNGFRSAAIQAASWGPCSELFRRRVDSQVATAIASGGVARQHPASASAALPACVLRSCLLAILRYLASRASQTPCEPDISRRGLDRRGRVPRLSYTRDPVSH